MWKPTFTVLLSVSLLAALALPVRVDETTDRPPLTPAEDSVESVINANLLLSEQHVKPVSQGQLVDWAITGRYLL
jgi:hypothetical protein